jgi:protein ImuA
VFLFRPAAAQHESSAAPLRVMTTLGVDWELQVQVFKRRGPAHEGRVHLPSIPGGLSAVLTPRLLRPSRLLAARDAQREVPAHALVGPAAAVGARRPAAAT